MLNPIALSLGPIRIHWYGITAAAAAAACFVYTKWLNKKLHVAIPLESVIFWAIVWGFVGARLYHVLNEFSFYVQNPLLIPALWRGGLAIHGGIIAGVVVVVYFAKKYTVPFWKIADLLAPMILVGLSIARWGNFFNQELFGKPTKLPWGISIDPANRPEQFAEFARFHPTFLYESLLNALFVAFITWWIIKKNPQHTPGKITGAALAAFGLARFLVELLRIDRVPIILGIRLPLLVSLALIMCGSILFFRKKKKAETHVLPSTN